MRCDKSRPAVNWAVTNHYKWPWSGDATLPWLPRCSPRTKYRSFTAQNLRLAFAGYGRIRRPIQSATNYCTAAGVQVIFGNGLGSMDAALTKNLSVLGFPGGSRFGLPEAEALKGLTLYPRAGCWRRETGSARIEPGKDATLFAADGDNPRYSFPRHSSLCRGQGRSASKAAIRGFMRSIRNRPEPHH